MSGEREHQSDETLRERVRNNLGKLIGARPTWFDETAWSEMGPNARRAAVVLHDRGRDGFHILRSAETPLHRYTRRTSDEQID